VRKQSSKAGQSLKGRRFSPEQRQHALVLVRAGMKRQEIARVIGTTAESIRRWLNMTEAAEPRQAEGTRAPAAAPMGPAEDGVQAAAPASPEAAGGSSPPEVGSVRSPFAPHDPGQGLAEWEVAAILEYKRKHPSMGPAQIRAQLKRFKGWRISIKAIHRVLRAHGYESVHRASRPQGPEPCRFEAPRPNALWQMDHAEVRVGPEKFSLLLVLDDFSRFVVGHALLASPDAQTAIGALGQAIARHGKPEAIRTDRGGGFLAAPFVRFLEVQLIDHVVGRPYRPQGGGKVEALVATVRRELWDVEHFPSPVEAHRRLDEFIEDYNHHRAHMGIDGLTPADRYFGRARQVLAAIDAASRKRQALLAGQSGLQAPSDDLATLGTGPLEVLRLVLAEGQLELRFLGARVRLGRIEP